MENINVLSSNQQDDLYELFAENVNKLDLDYEKCVKYFEKGSDTFVRFFLQLEENTEWFDYSQAEDVINELSIFISEMKR